MDNAVDTHGVLYVCRCEHKSGAVGGRCAGPPRAVLHASCDGLTLGFTWLGTDPFGVQEQWWP